MAGLRSFLFFNNISQLEVANYLGISKGQMSKLVSGAATLRPEQLMKLITNDKGWKTDFLVDNTWDSLEMNGKRIEDASEQISSLKREIEMLRMQLEKSEKRNDEYWCMIQRLTSDKK